MMEPEQIQQLEERVATLTRHLDFLGWDSDGVAKAEARIVKLELVRDLFADMCAETCCCEMGWSDEAPGDSVVEPPCKFCRWRKAIAATETTK